jgi:hypothetical protein
MNYSYIGRLGDGRKGHTIKYPFFWVCFLIAVIGIALSVRPSFFNKPSGLQPDIKSLNWALASPATGPLQVDSVNPRYFTDGSGKAILLTGSHTWANFQDAGEVNPPPVFDYAAYLDFLQQNHHNFFRLWTWEQTMGIPSVAGEFRVTPSPYQRTGPGTALDGKLKFDLTQFYQAYFDRLRERVIQAGERGIYVSIMLFNGFSIDDKGTGPGNAWPGHPFNLQNNINGVNGDLNNNGNGEETHTLQSPAITALQEAYVRKVIDTVNDLDNVLYEISNESPSNSQDWQYHMINYVKSYEAGKPKQHPVGMTVEYPGGDNGELFASPADWISPNDVGGYKDNPPVANGSKVILTDTDHLWGIGGDRQWVWKNFTRGLNPIYMDCYNRIYCPDVDPNDPTRISLIKNMGYTLAYASRMNLEKMVPHGELASTRYALAYPVASGAEYLVYLPSGGTRTVDLRAVSGTLTVEWFNPSDGTTTIGGTTTGGAIRSFTPPFGGEAVLYIYQASPSTPTPTNGPTPTETQTPNRNTIYLPIIKNGVDISWLMGVLLMITTPLVWWMNSIMGKK